jgi:hypothetical protein
MSKASSGQPADPAPDRIDHRVTPSPASRQADPAGNRRTYRTSFRNGLWEHDMATR